MNEWLIESVAGLPPALWMFVGLGLPWALVALPRPDWSRLARVFALAFAFGPAWMSVVLLGFGTVGGARSEAWMRFDLTMGTSVVICLLGVALTIRKLRHPPDVPREGRALAFDERIIILLIVLALLVRWVTTAFWTFTTYDALWVYGYQARLYFLNGFIPQDVGYYPQFLQLQYTFQQLASGEISDYAARQVIPFLHIGSILAAFVLGERLFSRRAGFFMAGLWALYPHVATWAHIGDLEIPQTFLLTLTAAFLLPAWVTDDRKQRRRDALIAGLVFGIAMWTKPTAGAFIIGVLLLVIADFGRTRGNIQTWWPRFEVATIMGIACVPLGAAWYLRNIALGLPPLVFPHESWPLLATRSGDLLSWPLLAVSLPVLVLVFRGPEERWRLWPAYVGVGFLLLGAVPSSPLFNPARRNSPESYLRLYEWLLIVAGLVLIAWAMRQHLRRHSLALSRIGWAYLLATPYFALWFWSYSYHARLSLAITPIMMLPVAVLLAETIPQPPKTRAIRFAWIGVLLLAGIPAALLTYFSADRHDDWLWTARYPNDVARYLEHNPGVTLSAIELLTWREQNGREPLVVAPGEQRLRFFLPQATIITDTVPTTYAELGDATHYQYGTQARWRYENDEGIDPATNAVVSSLGRTDIMTQVLAHTGTFRYELYELALENRWRQRDETPILAFFEDEVIIGDFVRFHGANIGNNALVGNRIFLEFLFEPLMTTLGDDALRLRLQNDDTATVHREWIVPFFPTQHSQYRTFLWEPGEQIVVPYSFLLESVEDLPKGENYRLVVDFVSQRDGNSLPVQINGETTNGYPLPLRFFVDY